MEEIDLYTPETYNSGVPYEYFKYLREEKPMFRHPHPTWETGFWNAVCYEDVQFVSRNSNVFHSLPHPFLEETNADDESSSEMLISKDPPDHTKMRKLVNRGFTPRRVADMTENIQKIVDELIDAVAEGKSCDLVHDIAMPLPLRVIADMVGVPREDHEKVFEWTEITFGFDASFTAEQRSEAAINMYAYAQGLCEDREKNPQDDLITILGQAEIDGESLTQHQIDLFFLLLQNAGSETTRNLITSGMYALMENPDQLELLQNDMSLIPSAVEEMLRYTTPVTAFKRTAGEDIEVAGEQIKAGDRIVLWYVSANRDEKAFENPDQLNVRRDPNEHFSFGAGGPHFCLGASLARLEGNIMFRELVSRFEGMELDGIASKDELPRVYSNLIDGFAKMPVKWSEVKEKQPA